MYFVILEMKVFKNLISIQKREAHRKIIYKKKKILKTILNILIVNLIIKIDTKLLLKDLKRMSKLKINIGNLLIFIFNQT